MDFPNINQIFAAAFADLWTGVSEEQESFLERDFLKPFVVNSGTSAFGVLAFGRSLSKNSNLFQSFSSPLQVAAGLSLAVSASDALHSGLVGGGAQGAWEIFSQTIGSDALSGLMAGGSTALTLGAMALLSQRAMLSMTTAGLVGAGVSVAMSGVQYAVKGVGDKSIEQVLLDVALGAAFAGLSTALGYGIGTVLENTVKVPQLLRPLVHGLAGRDRLRITVEAGLGMVVDSAMSFAEWGSRAACGIADPKQKFRHFFAQNVGSGIVGNLAPGVLKPRDAGFHSNPAQKVDQQSLRYLPNGQQAVPLEHMIGLMGAMEGLRNSNPSLWHAYKCQLLSGTLPVAQMMRDLHALHPHTIKPVSMAKVIYQSGDPYRSVVELSANAIDAGSLRVEIEAKDGYYRVTDEGKGISPDVLLREFLQMYLSDKDGVKTHGRFGIGWDTVFRHLISGSGNRDRDYRTHLLPGAEVVVETKNSEGAYRVHYTVHEGEILWHSQEINDPQNSFLQRLGDKPSGTRITVRSPELKGNAIKVEARRFLSYADTEDVNIRFNDVQINTMKVRDRLAVPGATLDRVAMSETEGTAKMVVVVGKVMLEEIPLPQASESLVLRLPTTTTVSQIREGVVVDDTLLASVHRLIDGVRDTACPVAERLSVLNALAAWAEKVHTEHRNHATPSVSQSTHMIDMIRRRVWQLTPAGVRLYPETEPWRALGTDEKRLLVHPALYDATLLHGFEVPKEFKGGIMRGEDGVEQALHAVVSPELDTVGRKFFMDRDHGVIYLAQSAYRSAQPGQDVVFAAWAKIPYPRIKELKWQVSDEVSVVATRNESVEHEPPTISDEAWTSGVPELDYLKVADSEKQKVLALLSQYNVETEKVYELIHNIAFPMMFRDVAHRSAVYRNEQVQVDWTYCDLLQSVTPLANGAAGLAVVRSDGYYFGVYRQGKPTQIMEQVFSAMHSVTAFADGSVGMMVTKSGLIDQFVVYQIDGDRVRFLSGQEAEPYWQEYMSHYPLRLMNHIALEHLLDPRMQVRLEKLLEWGLAEPKEHLGMIMGLSEDAFATLAKLDRDDLAEIMECMRKPYAARYFDLYHEGLEDGDVLRRIFKVMDAFSAADEQDVHYAEKVHAILPHIDWERVTHEKRSGIRSLEVEALESYFSMTGELPVGESALGALSARRQPLASVIHGYRTRGWNAVGDIAPRHTAYDEIDHARLLHAIHHLDRAHPMVYLREWIKNSMDALRGYASEKRITLDVVMSPEGLLSRIHDPVGMDETEVMMLLIPDESRKPIGSLGEFGVGFYSALRNARRVRVKTAKPGSKTAIMVEFAVLRDAAGKVTSVDVAKEIIANEDGFSGTTIERLEEEHGPIPYRYAQTMAYLKELVQVVSPDLARIWVNGEPAPQTLRVLSEQDSSVGQMQLSLGAEDAILIGLDQIALTEEDFAAVPDPVRRLFVGHGIRVSLDPQRAKVTETRDRFRGDHAQTMREIREALPSLMVKGYLKRVLDREDPTDLHMLPKEYFIEAYGLAEESTLRDVIDDARALNNGENGIDYNKYCEPDGRRLIKLLTLLDFIPDPDDPGHYLSLRKLYDRSQRTREGAPIQVSHVVSNALTRAASSRDAAATAYDRIAPERRDRVFDKAEQDPATQRYLTLLERLIKAYYKGEVVVGTNTIRNWMNFYALHFLRRGTYHLYRSETGHLEKAVQDLDDIVKMEEGSDRNARLRAFVVKELETITHELTHVKHEIPNTDFTHDERFYDLQAELLLGPRREIGLDTATTLDPSSR